MIGLPRLATPPSCGRASWVGTSDTGGCSLFLEAAGRFCTGAAGASGSVGALVLRAGGWMVGLAAGAASAADFTFVLAGLACAAVLGSGAGIVLGLIAAVERFRAGFKGIKGLVMAAGSVVTLVLVLWVGGCMVALVAGVVSAADFTFVLDGLVWAAA